MFIAEDCKNFGRLQGKAGMLPQIVAVPANLLEQWRIEMHRWWKFGSFAVLPYTGACTTANRGAFWQQFDELKSPMNRRIILASIPVRTCTILLT